MSQQIKAIQTRYKGYKFRSRTEARWAVFFDHCGIEWEYEKEGYDISQYSCHLMDHELGLYLPDFWLPKEDTWVEIKGALPTDYFCFTDEEAKVHALVCHTKARCGHLFYGVPDADIPTFTSRFEGSHSIYGNKEFGSASAGRSMEGVIALGQVDTDLPGGVEAARSARFEFGESGAC